MTANISNDLHGLSGRNVVITGGTGVLGSAVTRALVDAGAVCHIPCFQPSTPERFELAEHEQVKLSFAVDLTSETSIASFYGSIQDHGGELWASVHVAGGFAMGPLVDTSLADFRRMVDLNGVTCFLSCREAARAMTAGGRMVNVAAQPVVQPVSGMVAYSTSKAMVASMTQSLALELSPRGILVNAVLPSIIDTPGNRASMPNADHDAWPKPSEIAETIRFLVSPHNALTSGALVPVYGRA